MPVTIKTLSASRGRSQSKSRCKGTQPDSVSNRRFFSTAAQGREAIQIKAAPSDKFTSFTFWCGYLPDRDTREQLKNKNEFLLRQMQNNDSLHLSIALEKDRICDIEIVRDGAGFRLDKQRRVLPTIMELIEMYWCTKLAIIYGSQTLRLEVPASRPSWLLCSSSVRFSEVLGVGAFGTVRKGILVDVAERIHVAVKQLKLDCGQEDIGDIWKEARTMRNLRHKYIVTFHGICNDCMPFSLVIEYVNGSSVDKFLQKEGKNSDVTTRLKILLDATKGMQYLHSQSPPFLHLDLASRNLLIHWEGWNQIKVLRSLASMIVKVADFGMTRQGVKHRIDINRPMNIRWMCPHSFNTATVDRLTDVWAFAVTMWEVFLKGEDWQIPYHGLNGQKVYDEVILASTNERRKLDRPELMPLNVHRVMKNCMLSDERRNERPNFTLLQDTLERIYKELKNK